LVLATQQVDIKVVGLSQYKIVKKTLAALDEVVVARGYGSVKKE